MRKTFEYVGLVVIVAAFIMTAVFFIGSHERALSDLTTIYTSTSGQIVVYLPGDRAVVYHKARINFTKTYVLVITEKDGVVDYFPHDIKWSIVHHRLQKSQAR